MFDKINLDELAKIAGEKTGRDPADIKKAVNSDKFDEMLSKLKKEDAEKLQKVLSNREETEKLLSSPAAKMLIRKLTGK